MRWIPRLPSRQKRIIGVIIAVLLLVSLRFIWPFVFNNHTQPKAVQGSLDLRQWDFQKKGKVKLQGEWAFIPFSFVLSDPKSAAVSKPLFIDTPHKWTPYLTANNSTSFGFATYRLNILLPNKPASLSSTPIHYGIRVTNIRSSYTLFVNGIELGGRGKPGEAYSDYKADNYPNILFTNLTGPKAEIILHVANFDNQSGGGILLPIEFGTPDQILKSKRNAEISDAAIFVLFILLAIFCGFLYNYQSRQIHLLHFCLFCLSTALYIATNSEKLLVAVLSLPFELYSKLQMLSTAGMLFYAYMFIVRLYPALSRSAPLWIMRVVSIGVTCLLTFTPLRFFSSYLPYWFYFMWLMVIYMLAILFRAVLSHREDAPYLFLAGIALMCNGIQYILLIYDIVLPVVPPIDLFVFALSLMLLVTQRFVKTMEQVEALSLQRVRMEMAFMQAQIKPHFLFNSLNTIGAFIETEPDRAQDLLGEFSTYLRYSFDFTNLEPTVPFDREWYLVEAYLKLEQARYGDILNVYVDVVQAKSLRIPPISLQPLVENAVRHGVMMRPEGGTIRIIAKEVGNAVELSIEDNGVGIPPQRLAELLTYTTSDDVLLPTHVHGIGLKNIQHRFLHTYGRGLSIHSVEQQGTLIKFLIPKEATILHHGIQNTFN